ncbi:MAG TPA: GAF domain-containing protein, partial [Candidatus Dormibacteraeota bacterium]|nr:GAF domain-containing protein [Candidatus Dormibacteraeota bacterium]
MAGSRTSREAQSLEHAHGHIAEEQAALRRVATLVAAGAPPSRLFESVTCEVGRLIGADAASMTRVEPGADVTSLGLWSRANGYQRVGTRYRRDPGTLAALILETGLPARINFDSGVGGRLAEFARAQGWRSAVGAPVIVDGHIWGLIVVASTSERLLPDDTETRLAKFSELVSTAISNAKRAEEVALLAQEQAALRRVATLVARGVPRAKVFAAVAREIGQLLAVDATHLGRYESGDAVVGVASWSRGQDRVPEGMRFQLTGDNVSDLVRRSGRPARLDRYDGAEGPIAEMMRELGIRSSVGVPITVEGRLWGVIAVSSKGDDPLPSDTEARTAAFTELVATAIANSESREDASRLTQEQAALRRVATLVAHQASPAEMFGKVAGEAAQIMRTDAVGMLRFEPDETATLVAQSATPWDPPPLGTRFTLDGDNVVTSVFRTSSAARLDDWSNATGATAAMARTLGIRSSVATPIMVERRLWGTMVAVSAQAEPLPAETESRLSQFTELVATAISNAEARGELAQLADEQAALRRVATLVAQGASQEEVFTAIAEALGRVLGIDDIRVVRYDDVTEAGGTAVVVATWGDLEHVLPIGERRPLGGTNVTTLALKTGKPARIDDYRQVSGPIGELVTAGGIRCAVAIPITVEGRIWGAMIGSSVRPDALSADIEPRLAQFTELLGTAVANTEARTEIGRLADEQAALRRVATMVAEESPPAQLFAKVAEEAGKLLGPHIDSAILRYESDAAATVMAVWGQQPEDGILVGTRMAVDGSSVTAQVLRERRPVRIDNYPSAHGDVANHAHKHGLRGAVGSPILVQGRLWGAMVVGRYDDDPFPAGVEQRVSQFTDLVATAIANTEARAEVERL